MQIINLIQEMLPHVAALNLLASTNQTNATMIVSGNEFPDSLANTTSQHYTWVQSEHPYKPATVSNYR